MKKRLLIIIILFGIGLTFAGGDTAAEENSVRSTPSSSSFKALIIGVSDYAHPDIQDLDTPSNDAKRLKRILETKYKFQTELLVDQKAAREEILNALKSLSNASDANSSILIYYSGHGQYDRQGNYGWWIPSDAEPNNFLDSIDNIYVHEVICQMKARHVLLISDAAFTSRLLEEQKVHKTQGEKEAREKIGILKSRQALVSGVPDPIASSGDPVHSVLAYRLIQVLADNTEPYIDLDEIFKKMKSLSPEIMNEKLSYGVLRNAGHEGGTFFLNAHLEGELKVRTIPESCEVKIVNSEQVYDDRMLLKAGDYLVEASCPGYHSKTEKAVILPGKTTFVDLKLKKISEKISVKLIVKPEIQSIQLGTKLKKIILIAKTNAPEADFFWELDGPGDLISNGAESKRLYVLPEKIDTPEEQVEIFVDAVSKSGLTAGDGARFHLYSTGRIMASTNAKNTTIYIDNEYKGTAQPGKPLWVKNVPAGQSQVIARLGGYQKSVSTQVQPGMVSKVSVRFGAGSAETLALIGKGDNEFLKENFDDAIRYYKKVLMFEAENEYARNKIRKIKKIMENREKAMEMIEQMLGIPLFE